MIEGEVISEDRGKGRIIRTSGTSGVLYGLGFIGALVYYIHFHSGTFQLVVLAILKAIVWPALLVYHLLVFLNA